MNRAATVRQASELIESERKRQKLENDAVLGSVVALIEEVEAMKEKLQRGDVSCKDALLDLQEAAKRADDKTRESHRRRTQSLPETTNRVIEGFSPCQLYQTEDIDGHPWTDRKDFVLAAILNHFYTRGLPRVAEALENEVGVAIDPANKLRYAELHRLKATVEERRITETHEWAMKVHEEFAASGASSRDPAASKLGILLRDLLFTIHKLSVVLLLQSGERAAALCYIRKHLTRTVPPGDGLCSSGKKTEEKRWREIQRLIGRLAFVPAKSSKAAAPKEKPENEAPVTGKDDALGSSQNAHVDPLSLSGNKQPDRDNGSKTGDGVKPLPPQGVSPCAAREAEQATPVKRHRLPYDAEALWTELMLGLVACWCEHNKLARHPHLTTTVAAGDQALPTLQKYQSLPVHFRRTKVLHVPVLPKGMVFRSSISCPVTQEVTTSGDGSNPAMLLPCCHVISRQAIHTLIRPPHDSFKCPYCPSESRYVECQPLFL
ncbi:LisH domain-containing protein C29A3.03c [Diplonema papillatum]|nr:LisH domain-containing protein C29A3.03c [Diplonema papillatum]